MSFNATNPVSVGLATKKDHYDRVFDNTLDLRAGGIAIASQAALDFIHASSATQLARVAAVAGKYPRLNAGGTAWEMNLPTAGKHTLYVPAAAMRPMASNGCGWHETVESGNGSLAAMPFDAATAEYAAFAVRLPKAWNEGTVTFTPLWLNKAGGSGNVVWRLYAGAVGDGESINFSAGSPQASTDGAQSANFLAVGPESAAITVSGSPAAGDLVEFLVERYASDAGDTYGSDAYLVGVVITLTTDAETDD